MAEYDEIYQKLNGKLVQIVDKNYGDDNYLKLDVSNIGGKPEKICLGQGFGERSLPEDPGGCPRPR